MSEKTTLKNKPPGIPLHMPLCMRFFDESLEEELHRGLVTHTRGNRFAVRSIDEINPAEQTRADIYYRDKNHQFVRVQAVTTRSHVDDEQSTFEMELLADQGKYAEQRGTFRVSVADQGMKVIIDARPDCRPLDICAEGLGVITTKPLKIGQTVSVNIVFDGQRIDGLMIVRAVRERKDKKYRCGLQSPSKNKELLKSLQNISMTVQRELLSRLAAIETTTKQLGGGSRTAMDRTSPVSKRRKPKAPGSQSGHEKSGDPMADKKPAQKARAKTRTHKPGEKPEPSTESEDTQTRDRLAFEALIDEYLTEDDQRDNVRRKWRMQVVIMLPSKDVTRVIRTDALDLSRGGYSFRTYRDVPYGSVVKTEITLHHKVFKISGTVRHCTRVSERDYQVGVQFEDVTRKYNSARGRGEPVGKDALYDEVVNAEQAEQAPAGRDRDNHVSPSGREAVYVSRGA